jgi:hypothetical protein
MDAIPAEYRGWWRITHLSNWPSVDLDILGPAVLSLTGGTDRLRAFVLLAYIQARPTKTGVSFTWQGSWEFDELTGTGTVKVGRDGTLKGTLRIKDGDSTSFTAERTKAPDGPIQSPPSYRDKWRRRW